MPSTPLEYMLEVMWDADADDARRDRMAIAAAPYVHMRIGDAALGKKARQQLEAQSDGQGTDWEGLLQPPVPKLTTN